MGAEEPKRPAATRLGAAREYAEERGRLLDEVRDVDFPAALRGYGREAVDEYVRHVNRVIAELEITRSPEAAVRHALDEVGEETRDILQRAHETADEITARSRAKADDRVQLAERESSGVRKAAEARVHELDADAEAIWQERHRLLEDVRRVAATLVVMADEAAERFPAALPAEARGAATTPAEEIGSGGAAPAGAAKEPAADGAAEADHDTLEAPPLSEEDEGPASA